MADSARTATRVACLASLAAAATTGTLPLPLVACYLLAQVVLAVLAPAGRAASALVPVLALSGLGAALLVQGGGSLPRTLCAALVGLQTAVVVGLLTSREQRTALLTAFGTVTLAASTTSDPLRGVPVLVALGAGLAALASMTGVRGRQLVAPVALTGVVGVGVFLAVPTPALRSQLGSSVSGSVGGERAAQFSSERLDLRARGQLPDTPMLSVDAASPSLWRAQVFYRYDGRGWDRRRAAFGQPRQELALLPASSSQATYDAVPLDGAAGDVWAPGQIAGFRAARSLDVGVTRDGTVTAVPPTPYTVTVEPQVLVAESGPDDPTAADAPDPFTTGLPPRLPSRVGDLARAITAGAEGRAAQARALSAWLRSEMRYSLDSPVPSRDEDAVDRFLFVDKVGFCEQFAAAEVVMLRSLGVPARLVTGLAYGQDEGGRRVYRAKDLHAWVELWVPGTGWVTDDPTAGSQPAAAGSSVLATARLQFHRALDATVEAVGGRSAAAALLGLVGLGIVVLVRRPVSRRAPQRHASTATAAYLRWNARLGQRGRRGPESLRELGSREPQVAPALQVVEQELYAAVRPDPGQAVELLDRS